MDKTPHWHTPYRGPLPGSTGTGPTHYTLREQFEPCPWWRLWRRHLWSGGKQYGWDGTPFSMSPIFGERECSRCGKRQRFLYDSQGGAWETTRAGVQ